MISFMVPTKPDWSGLVLSTQNLSYNSEFVHLPSWYRPQGSHSLGEKAVEQSGRAGSDAPVPSF